LRRHRFAIKQSQKTVSRKPTPSSHLSH